MVPAGWGCATTRPCLGSMPALPCPALPSLPSSSWCGAAGGLSQPRAPLLKGPHITGVGGVRAWSLSSAVRAGEVCWV